MSFWMKAICVVKTFTSWLATLQDFKIFQFPPVDVKSLFSQHKVSIKSHKYKWSHQLAAATIEVLHATRNKP